MDALFPPGPQKHLLLGNAVEFRHDPLTAMVDAARDYGDIVHFRFGPSHAYLVTSADYMHYVLVERPDLFDARQHFYRAIQSALGHELFAPKDGVCKVQKSTSPLPYDWLNAHAETIVRAAEAVITGWQEDKAVNVYEAFRELTLQITAATLFASDADEMTRQLASTIPNSTVLQNRRFTSPWTVRLFSPDRAQDTVMQLLRQRRLSPISGDDVLSRFAGAPHADDEIAADLIRLFHALHEGAATTLSWALYLLAQHPEVQSDLQAELDAVLAGRAPTADDLPQLAYTEMVLRETMRLYPPSWLVCRQTRRETRLGDFFLPAGSTVLCSPYIMQRSPRNFVEPHKFLPERFGAGYEKRMRRFAFAPFGTDSRLESASMLTEMKLLLATIASRFSGATSDKHPTDIDPGLSLRPLGGLRLRLHARVERGTTAPHAN